MFLLSEPEDFGDASPCHAQILNLKRFESGALDRSVAIVENASRAHCNANGLWDVRKS
jgi:hypothetical protein